MDYVKMLTKAAVRAIVMMLIIMGINMFLVGLLPAWVASIPVELSVPVLVSLIIGFIALDWVEKSFLKKYV